MATSENLAMKKKTNQQNLSPKFFECKEVGSGDVDSVLSQLDRELKLCEDIMKRPKFNKEANSCCQDQEKLEPASTNVEKDVYSLEVCAILIKVIAMVIGLALKQSVLRLETINCLFCSWIGFLAKLRAEIKAKKTCTTEEHCPDSCRKWCDFIKHHFKKVDFRSILLAFPLIVLSSAYIISNIFLMINKLLVVKIPVPKNLLQMFKKY